MKLINILTFLLISSGHASTIFSGKITLAKQCQKDNDLMVFVGSKKIEKQFLYQFPAVANGEFSFQLLAGDYWIEAISKDGCYGKLPLHAQDKDSSENFTLQLMVKENDKK